MTAIAKDDLGAHLDRLIQLLATENDLRAAIKALENITNRAKRIVR